MKQLERGLPRESWVRRFSAFLFPSAMPTGWSEFTNMQKSKVAKKSEALLPHSQPGMVILIHYSMSLTDPSSN